MDRSDNRKFFAICIRGQDFGWLTNSNCRDKLSPCCVLDNGIHNTELISILPICSLYIHDHIEWAWWTIYHNNVLYHLNSAPSTALWSRNMLTHEIASSALLPLPISDSSTDEAHHNVLPRVMYNAHTHARTHTNTNMRSFCYYVVCWILHALLHVAVPQNWTRVDGWNHFCRDWRKIRKLFVDVVQIINM